jgi:hypothetical protein
MRLIDKIYTEFPYFGSRQIKRMLRTLGHEVGRRRVSRLMRLMGLEALCPKPNLSKPAPGVGILVVKFPSTTMSSPLMGRGTLRLEVGRVMLILSPTLSIGLLEVLPMEQESTLLIKVVKGLEVRRLI